MSELLTISDGTTTVGVDPEAGGRIAQITFGETPLLVGRDEVGGDPLAWGAFPMVPWAGRIRHGRFEFRGGSYELPRNHGDHAMHGVGFMSAWTITDRTSTSITLHLDLPHDATWPFGGTVDQSFELLDGSLACTMTVTADDRALPVSFGWHPWFRKPEWLEFHPSAMFRRDDDHIAVDELVAVPDGPWDDCFVNHEPVRMRIDSVVITITSDCSHWVVYDEPEHATCVEPQTGPPDAFTIRPEVLEPGASRWASFRLRGMFGPDPDPASASAMV